MRAAIITASAFAAAALFVLGGFLNALSGFGFDTQSPYNDPSRVVGTFIGDVPGIGFALFALGLALWLAARVGARNWFIGLLIWPLFPAMVASLMYAGALADPIYWFVPLAFIPLSTLLFAIIAPPRILAPASGQALAASGLRFGIFAGILAVIVVGGVIVLYPSPQPTNAGSGGPPALQVNQASSTADCANGVYPTVTLTNDGAQPLTWKATSTDPNVAAVPASDQLPVGGTEQVSFSGKSTAPDVLVQFTVSGGSGNVAKFGCQPGGGK